MTFRLGWRTGDPIETSLDRIVWSYGDQIETTEDHAEAQALLEEYWDAPGTIGWTEVLTLTRQIAAYDAAQQVPPKDAMNDRLLAYPIVDRFRLASRKDKIWRWIACSLPRPIVMWAVFHMLAHATSGQWSNDRPDHIKVWTILERWDVNHD